MQTSFRSYFDYGAETSPDTNLIRWPTKGKRVCLIDGDILPYTIGFIVKDVEFLKAQSRVELGEAKHISETPEFLAYADIMNCMMNRMVATSDCDSMRLYLTKSSENYRIDTAFTKLYKGNRISGKPLFFEELRQYLMDTQDAVLACGEEADDLISIEAWSMAKAFCDEEGIEVGSEEHKAFANYVVISKDKDLMQIPGWHCSIKQREITLEWVTRLGFLRPKYKEDGTMKKLEGGGLKFLYAQILMGDDVDNYPGLPRCGMGKAFQTLKDCKDEKELYYATLALYKKKYGSSYPAINYRSTRQYYDEYFTVHGVHPVDYDPSLEPRTLSAYQMMLEQGRLAFMQTYKGEVWRAGKGTDVPLGTKESWNAKDTHI